MRIAASLITSLVLSLSSLTGCATTGADDDLSEVDGEASSAGKLTFWQASDGQWHFNLKSGNGSILLTSEAYTSRTGAINGALSTLENGVDSAQYVVKPAASKGFVINLKAANGQVISYSEVYSTKSNATRAVNSSIKAVTSLLDKREAATGARTEVLVGETGQFRFNVYAKNGKIILSSEQYTTEAAAFNGAFAVQTEGQHAAAYTLKQNTSGGFYFTVKAQNGEIIGTSQQYTTKASAESAMASLQSLLKTLVVL